MNSKRRKTQPFNPTYQQLKDYVGNVTFEAFMVREISQVTRPEDFWGFALLDSFLIHSRALFDFFTTGKRFLEDLLAMDYAPNWNPAASEQRLQVLKDESEKINTFLAHISYGRQKEVKNLGHRKQWPVVEIAEKLQKEWDDHFLIEVDSKFKADFPEWKLITF